MISIYSGSPVAVKCWKIVAFSERNFEKMRLYLGIFLKIRSYFAVKFFNFAVFLFKGYFADSFWKT